MLRPWSAIALPPEGPTARELAHTRRNDKAHACPSQTHAPQARFSRCSLRRYPTKSTPRYANRRDMCTAVFGHHSDQQTHERKSLHTSHTEMFLRSSVILHRPKSTQRYPHGCLQPSLCNQKAHQRSHRTRVNISRVCKRTCVAAKIFVKPSPRMSGSLLRLRSPLFVSFRDTASSCCAGFVQASFMHAVPK